eukprot:6189285-Pleurochrysis_carterae.AAC.2
MRAAAVAPALSRRRRRSSPAQLTFPSRRVPPLPATPSRIAACRAATHWGAGAVRTDSALQSSRLGPVQQGSIERTTCARLR